MRAGFDAAARRLCTLPLLDLTRWRRCCPMTTKASSLVKRHSPQAVLADTVASGLSKYQPPAKSAALRLSTFALPLALSLLCCLHTTQSSMLASTQPAFAAVEGLTTLCSVP